MNGPFPAHLVSVMSDRAQISDLSASLLNTARKDWMTLENLATEMPLTDDFAQPPPPAFSGRVRCGSIYDAAAMDDRWPGGSSRRALMPGAGPAATHGADEGEARRPRYGLAPLTPTGVAGMLVIRAPVIINALGDYFELLWDRASGPSAPQRLPTG